MNSRVDILTRTNLNQESNNSIPEAITYHMKISYGHQEFPTQERKDLRAIAKTMSKKYINYPHLYDYTQQDVLELKWICCNEMKYESAGHLHKLKK